MKAINVNKMTQAGFTFKFWVADFFAKLNGKMGGDISKIRTVGKYMIEIWKVPQTFCLFLIIRSSSSSAMF